MEMPKSSETAGTLDLPDTNYFLVCVSQTDILYTWCVDSDSIENMRMAMRHDLYGNYQLLCDSTV